MRTTTSALCLLSVFLISSCSKKSEQDTLCNTQANLLSSFITPDGDSFQIYEDGSAYQVNDACAFADQVFEPGFETEKYVVEGDATFIKMDDGTLYEVVRSFKEDFEGYEDWRDIFIKDVNDRERVFTNLTLQSPSAKTVASYLDLRNCLWDETCEFLDNKVDLVPDPANPDNTVFKFYSVAPTNDMIVSKCSMATDASYYKKGEDFWFSARYYVDKGMPLTIADFESSHVLRWGPRVLLDPDKVVIENKFTEKKVFGQTTSPAVKFPIKQWVKITVHLRYDEIDGVIQMWQDDELVVDAQGPNIPLDNWIQDVIEIGLSAVVEETILYVDDVEFGPERI